MPPTVYRPPQRPVAPASAKKFTGQLIGLIAAGVAAVVGLGLAGLMWSGKSAADATVAQFKDSASALGSALGVSLAADTNTPIDWNAAWSTLDKAVSDQKKVLAEAQAQGVALDQQVTELKVTADELALLKPKSDQQAALLKKTTDELAALKVSGADQVAALQQELEGAKQALADAQAAAEAIAAQATASPATDMNAEPAAAPASSADPALATVPNATPAASDAAAPTDAAVVAAGAAGVATETAGAEGSEAVPVEEVSQGGSFTFPEENSTLKEARYDGAGKILTLTLENGTELVYRGVPPELYDGLIGAPVPEVYFRMKLVGNFPVTPDDKEALRGLRYR